MALHAPMNGLLLEESGLQSDFAPGDTGGSSGQQCLWAMKANLVSVIHALVTFHLD